MKDTALVQILESGDELFCPRVSQYVFANVNFIFLRSQPIFQSVLKSKNFTSYQSHLFKSHFCSYLDVFHNDVKRIIFFKLVFNSQDIQMAVLDGDLFDFFDFFQKSICILTFVGYYCETLNVSNGAKIELQFNESVQYQLLQSEGLLLRVSVDLCSIKCSIWVASDDGIKLVFSIKEAEMSKPVEEFLRHSFDSQLVALDGLNRLH